MDEKQSFIIEDLDDFHSVIKADEEWRVRRDLEAEVSAPNTSFKSSLTRPDTHPAREEYLQPGMTFLQVAE